MILDRVWNVKVVQKVKPLCLIANLTPIISDKPENNHPIILSDPIKLSEQPPIKSDNFPIINFPVKET